MHRPRPCSASFAQGTACEYGQYPARRGGISTVQRAKQGTHDLAVRAAVAACVDGCEQSVLEVRCMRELVKRLLQCDQCPTGIGLEIGRTLALHGAAYGVLRQARATCER